MAFPSHLLSGNSSMSIYVDHALFVYAPKSAYWKDPLLANPFNVAVESLPLAEFFNHPQKILASVEHLVFSGTIEDYKKVLRLASQYGFSLGVLPMSGQDRLRGCYDLPKRAEDAIALALRCDAQLIDLLLCNDKIVLFKASLGHVPLLEKSNDHGVVISFLRAAREIFTLRLFPFSLTTGSGKRIDTAACGCMIIQHHRHSLAARLVARDSSLSDGMISLIVFSPTSVTVYLKFLILMAWETLRFKHFPSAMGFIRSSQLDIFTEPKLKAIIDHDEEAPTPLHCETLAKAVRVNVGESLRAGRDSGKTIPATEVLKIDNLPRSREVIRAIRKKIPLFGYAGEERFRDLFIALRKDAKSSPTYLILLVLSTLLASVGLFQSSAPVVIGAMLLAPLMGPIISLAMALLRRNTGLAREALMTIVVGVLLALSASVLIAMISPDRPITPEIKARLNPTLLDLGVALISGVAGAYTKAHREILQSLAGVSIAVALVPPLAVAGIGLGKGDLYVFLQAFLLFSTNLIGITLSAVLTFRVLGYASAVGSKRGLLFFLVLMILVSIPLSISYKRIVEDRIFTQSWRKQRFLVNDKYLIVQNADLTRYQDKRVLTMEILTREALNREDLALLKDKVQFNFSQDLVIRVRLVYIP